MAQSPQKDAHAPSSIRESSTKVRDELGNWCAGKQEAAEEAQMQHRDVISTAEGCVF